MSENTKLRIYAPCAGECAKPTIHQIDEDSACCCTTTNRSEPCRCQPGIYADP